MKKIYIVAIMLLSAMIVFGQMSRELADFKELEVTDKLQVEIIPSTYNKLIIEGELANQVEIIQVSDVLRLKMTGSYILQGGQIVITLYSNKLAKITAKKGAQVVTYSNTLHADSLDLSATEGASIALEIKSNHLESLVTTGASIRVEGDANSQEINVALGGSYNANYLTSDKAIAKINGGGKIIVNVSQSFDGLVRAGGTIDVYGKPKERKQSKLVGGKINYL